MERDQATKFINDLLKLMVGRNGSDLFITGDFPPAIKVDGKVTKVSPQPLNAVHTLSLARSIMNDKQIAEFERTKESNFAISPPGIGRFRVNAFIQQGKVGMVIKMGPSAFVDDASLGIKFYGQKVQPGDLVMYRSSDGIDWDYLPPNVPVRIHFRILTDAHIQMTVPRPDVIL